ncbi:MAG: methionyl-tRNA formyltransferase [Bryobacterales bacterium]|jgi:methionyl-tRNA formyltransferase|nr:methionyl-tRNA formyltransferase [Bryobacterales bacterium]
MDLIFLGTPEFAVPSLRALVEAGHRVHAVYTQPDRPAGRGQKLAASPVKEAAIALGIPVEQPRKIREPHVVQQLQAARPEAMVVVGYGQILPQSILDIPPLGIINVHGSLLPKYRGAAPIQWAVARGETVTGVTTMRIDAGLDTGAMLLTAQCPIGADETAMALWERLADMGARLLVETMDGLANGRVQPLPQDDSAATYAPILKKDDGLVDWTRPAQEIYNRYRGFQPWPGAWTSFRGVRFQLKELRLGGPAHAEPGALLVDGKRLFAQCGDGHTVELLRVQLEGKAAVSAEAFRNGAKLQVGERLGAAISAAGQGEGKDTIA